MINKTICIVISVLVLLNIGQFVYFYSKVSDLKSEIKKQNMDGKNKNPQEKYYEEFIIKLNEYGKRNELTEEQIKIINYIIYHSIDKEQTINDIKKKLDENFTAEPIVNSKLGFIAWCNIQKPPLTPDLANPWIKEPMEGIPGEFNEFGLTADGRKWAYDPDKKTFIPYG
jgi:hypothetical protein